MAKYREIPGQDGRTHLERIDQPPVERVLEDGIVVTYELDREGRRTGAWSMPVAPEFQAGMPDVPHGRLARLKALIEKLSDPNLGAWG